MPEADVWERVSYEWTGFVVRAVVTDGRIFEPCGTFDFRVALDPGNRPVNAARF